MLSFNRLRELSSLLALVLHLAIGINISFHLNKEQSWSISNEDCWNGVPWNEKESGDILKPVKTRPQYKRIWKEIWQVFDKRRGIWQYPFLHSEQIHWFAGCYWTNMRGLLPSIVVSITCCLGLTAESIALIIQTCGRSSISLLLVTLSDGARGERRRASDCFYTSIPNSIPQGYSDGRLILKEAKCDKY